MSQSKADAMGTSAAFGKATGARSARSDAYARATGTATPAGAVTLEIDLKKIADNPENPRGAIDTSDEEFLDLVNSIREIGVTSPISVCNAAAFLKHHEQHRDAVGSADYVLLAGHRRTLAAPLAGRTTVPAQIDDAGAENPLVWALAENGLRVGLNPIQQAQALKKLTDKPPAGRGLSQGKVAKSIGKSQPYISMLTSLLNLLPELQGLVARGELIQREARPIARLPRDEQWAAYEALLAPPAVEPEVLTHNPVMGQRADAEAPQPGGSVPQSSDARAVQAPAGRTTHNPVMTSAAAAAPPAEDLTHNPVMGQGGSTAEPAVPDQGLGTSGEAARPVPLPTQSGGQAPEDDVAAGHLPWHSGKDLFPVLQKKMTLVERRRLASLILSETKSA